MDANMDEVFFFFGSQKFMMPWQKSTDHKIPKFITKLLTYFSS